MGLRSVLRDRAALGWVLYDFAYSIFSFLLVVRFFPSWVINDLNRPDWYVGATQFVVVIFVIAAMPLAGALADQLGRRKPFLVAFTLTAATAGALLSVMPAHGNILPLLVVAGIAVAFGQLALAQYDPLLADVAPPASRGRVSGLAVAFGFAGIVFALAVVAEGIVGGASKQRAFAPAGLFYVLFAIPAFLWIRDTGDAPARGPWRMLIRRATAQMRETASNLRHHRDAFQFLIGRFLYSDAIATLSAYLTVYMSRLGGFSEREKDAALGLAVVTAAVGALAAGRALPFLGPKRVLLSVLPIFALFSLLSAAVGEPWTVWLAAPVVGGVLGCVWTADRVFMLRLTPLELRGQLFGFFNLASRVASAFGPLVIWSGTVWLLHQHTGWLSALGASRVAIAGLALAALLGWAVIRPVSDRRRLELEVSAARAR